MKFASKPVLFLLLLAFSGKAVLAESHAPQCKLGVFPFLSAQRLEKIFAPIAAQLSDAGDCVFRYHSAATYTRFMDRLGKREYELAYIQPFDYVRIAVPNGYLPLAARNSQLTGTIVARKDGSVQRLADLKGKTVALPPKVAAVSYLTKAALEQAGLDIQSDVNFVYTKNHGSCLQQVLIGKADACGTVDTVVNMFENKNKLKLKWVAQTPSIPQSLFVVRDDIKPALRERLLQKFRTMKLNDAGQKLFRPDGSGSTFRKIEDSEFRVVRQYLQRFNAMDEK